MAMLKCNFKRLHEYLDNIQVFGAEQFVDEAFEKALRELADKLIVILRENTPVGPTPYRKHDNPGHTYGELRDSWPEDATGLRVEKTVDGYSIDVTNSAEYASWVESGHEQQPGRYVWYIEARLKRSYVKGKYFMKISEEEVAKSGDAIVRRIINQYLREVFGNR